jgi:hypothetical protein
MKPTLLKAQISSTFTFDSTGIGTRLYDGVHAIRTQFPDVHAISTKPRSPNRDDPNDASITITLTIVGDEDGWQAGEVEAAMDRCQFIFDDVFMGRLDTQLRMFDRETGEEAHEEADDQVAFRDEVGKALERAGVDGKIEKAS